MVIRGDEYMAFESVARLVGVIPGWVCGSRIRMHVFTASIGDRLNLVDKSHLCSISLFDSQRFHVSKEQSNPSNLGKDPSSQQQFVLSLSYFDPASLFDNGILRVSI